MKLLLEQPWQPHHRAKAPQPHKAWGVAVEGGRPSLPAKVGPPFILNYGSSPVCGRWWKVFCRLEYGVKAWGDSMCM